MKFLREFEFFFFFLLLVVVRERHCAFAVCVRAAAPRRLEVAPGVTSPVCSLAHLKAPFDGA